MKDENHWKIAGATLIVTDTVTTKIALSTDKFIEVNSLMNYIITEYGYIALALIKATVVALAYTAWYLDVGKDNKWDRKMHWLLPRFMAGIGTFVTFTNTIQIAIVFA